MQKGISLGQIPQIFRIALIIGITVGLSYIVLEAFQSGSYTATTVTNETIAFTNNTLASFANPFVQSITKVGNQTVVLTTANYSLINTAYQTYRILPFISTGANGNYNVTYIYNGVNRATAGMGYMLTFMDNIAANMPIVGFVIFAVIVIYLLNMYQTKQKGKSSGGA